MGVRLLEGRWFREEEMVDSNDAAIVNDFVAARLRPGASAVGQRVCVYCTPENPNNWKRVIGVVSSASHTALNEGAKGNIYLAAGAMRESYFVVVRTQRPSGDLEKAIRRTIAGIDPNQPVFLSTTMTALIADSVADRRFIMMLLAVTAGLALVMSAAGVYGVISYTTSRRTQEIGIRVAVGAMPWDVLALVFRQSLRSFLPGLESANLSHLWIAAGLVALTAGIACWIPARRATKIDPMSALRQE
jgi:putative ABC transport system permease protein